ncbi:MAG: tetratricopeptide repeat protein [Pseudomonadota bacterium]
MRVLFVIAAAISLAAAPSVAAKPPVQISQQMVSEAEKTSKNGDLEGAARLYEAAIVADPASVDAYVGLGQTQAALKRPKSAKRYFETAVKIDPNNLSALEAQSVHLITLGDLSEAERNINRLRRLCVNGCTELSTVLKAYDTALEETRTRVLGSGPDGR